MLSHTGASDVGLERVILRDESLTAQSVRWGQVGSGQARPGTAQRVISCDQPAIRVESRECHTCTYMYLCRPNLWAAECRYVCKPWSTGLLLCLPHARQDGQARAQPSLTRQWGCAFSGLLRLSPRCTSGSRGSQVSADRRTPDCVPSQPLRPSPPPPGRA